MTTEIREITDKISAILVSGIDARQVYLFGSYAQNKETEDSDLDIFVVADLSGKKKIEVT
ncbi:MAG: nucleotidyltransferase domain-containing protein [Ignavibacteriae bacterium]|nr:nucleotidyltransferase domain-containing protein [Ignavibacteriota bacterium]